MVSEANSAGFPQKEDKDEPMNPSKNESKFSCNSHHLCKS